MGLITYLDAYIIDLLYGENVVKMRENYDGQDIINKFEQLKEICREYMDDDDYVFGETFDRCYRKYIIIYKRTANTEHNENRPDVINSRTAVFRANELKVVKIISLKDLNANHLCVINREYDNSIDQAPTEIYHTWYIVGSVLTKYFDRDISKCYVRGDALHYYKTLKGAYLSRLTTSSLPHQKCLQYYDDRTGDELILFEVFDNNNGEIVSGFNAW